MAIIRRPLRLEALLVGLLLAAFLSIAAALAPPPPSSSPPGGGLLAASSDDDAALGDRAALDKVWHALLPAAGSDPDDDGAPTTAVDDTRARRALAALLGMEEDGSAAAGGDVVLPRGHGLAGAPRGHSRALRGVEVEAGMAPLSRYSATMQGKFVAVAVIFGEREAGRATGVLLSRFCRSPSRGSSPPPPAAPPKKPKNPTKKTTKTDIVGPKGYPLEEHKVTTDDGFILTMHRIPAGKYRHTELPIGTLPAMRQQAAAAGETAAANGPPKKKPAVLLHHGITLSSASFAVLNANESLAYVLADAGFDVWMANSRGNTFSWAHVADKDKGNSSSGSGPAAPNGRRRPADQEAQNSALRDPRYWQRTSMDDIALRDLPAQIDKVLEATQTRRVGFVGHSQGCALLLALLSERPEYNERVTAAAQMGPVTYVKELAAPFLKGGVENKVDQLLKRLAWVDPMPTRVTAPVLAGACRRWPVGGSCAKGMAYSFYGPSVHMTPDDYVEIGSVWPAGVGELLLLGGGGGRGGGSVSLLFFLFARFFLCAGPRPLPPRPRSKKRPQAFLSHSLSLSLSLSPSHTPLPSPSTTASPPPPTKPPQPPATSSTGRR
jgi:pimeloyl-ACP methyl ester carboxylesterase